MAGRQIAVYFSISVPDETSAPLGVLDNRFPALFEYRRMLWPAHERLSNPDDFDQGIAGFIDHVLLKNFSTFLEGAGSLTGRPVRTALRATSDSTMTHLDEAFLEDVDTLIVISFDSKRTGQHADAHEVDAVRRFLDGADRMVFVCPHHDIGAVDESTDASRIAAQAIESSHHGDRTIPAQQRFGGFGLSLLEGLGVPIRNRFGLRPAAKDDGSPTPIVVDHSRDRHALLAKVQTFNLHPHLPHFELPSDGPARFEILAQQRVDPRAPEHPFTARCNGLFDALLQTKEGEFAGTVLVSDATLWSSTAGGLESLERLWRNVALAPLDGPAKDRTRRAA